MNLKAAQDYLHDNYKETDRVAVLLKRSDEQYGMQRIVTVEKLTTDKYLRWLAHENHTNGKNIYVGVNTLKEDATHRTKDDVAKVRAVFLDLDHADPQKIEELREGRTYPKPNVVLTTSPGKVQFVWKVEGFTQQKAEELTRAMAYGPSQADRAVHDSARVLRIPGFHNTKYPDRPEVRAERLTDTVYRPENFPAVERAGPERTYRQERTKRDPGQITESERTWAEAGRRLARGDDPEQIISDIGRREAERGKHSDPYNYARNTVMNKLEAMNRERNPERISPSR